MNRMIAMGVMVLAMSGCRTPGVIVRPEQLSREARADGTTVVTHEYAQEDLVPLNYITYDKPSALNREGQACKVVSQ